MNLFKDSDMKELLMENNVKSFIGFIKKYDEQMVPVMKAKGYTCVHSMERTVAFTFGEFTFRRRRWKKGNDWVIPVDERLGLQKNVRFSLELMYQIARLDTMMSYDKVVHVIEMLYSVSITKPTVVKAVKLGTQLLKEQAEYHYFKDADKIRKEKVDIIYLEGDGVMVKAREGKRDNSRFDLSHFVVHTGRRQVGSKRFELQNKKEFIALSNRAVRDQVLNYLYQTYEISPETILITNSDGGHGYTPYVFKEIAKALNVKSHEHFIDAYHVNKAITSFFKPYSEEVLSLAQQAIYKNDKQAFRTALDTTESLLLTDEEKENFQLFKKRWLYHFHYTKPAKLRGLPKGGIGIMESQHRKVTYRMKNRGMYWTMAGAETMSQMILLDYEKKLYDLFLGDWRKDYIKRYSPMNTLSGAKWLRKGAETPAIHKVKLNLYTKLRDL